ncbi:hypothetical protein OPV22_031634 [Ensete ventricosum]|uniref:DNA N(6)-methyladenine demethylase n=1 Tax=Ensete ventricosum TaxID=4639 RepID=A0AAV8PPJ9_ENSVE|nr:hypothetical protein OPV22_031634 [Ensete ventricosum]
MFPMLRSWLITSSVALRSSRFSVLRRRIPFFSSSGDNKTTKMSGQGTPGGFSGNRASPHPRKPVSAGKSMYQGDGVYKPPNVFCGAKSPNTVMPQHSRASPESSGESIYQGDRMYKSPNVFRSAKSPNTVIPRHSRASPDSADKSTYESPYVFRNAKSPHTVIGQRSRASPDSIGRNTMKSPQSDAEMQHFDICKAKDAGHVILKRSLQQINREKRIEAERAKIVPQHIHLRPGMILLKNYLGHDDQVKIIKKCRDLGVSLGGFYRPGYQDGAKLHLRMMCLGMNWDPQSRSYDSKRSVDGAEPPKIPEDFIEIVDRAIQSSHDFLNTQFHCVNAASEVPNISPDLCIVNFYDNNGRLGLHQDRDESEESLRRGLPVISFSLGDTAKFLYGDQRDTNKAQEVELESGDVLIFGGKSRHIFHGVSSIIPITAPNWLIEETGMLPGRLNLTFRQY